MAELKRLSEWSVGEDDPNDALEIATMQAKSMRDAYLRSDGDSRNELWRRFTDAYTTDERVELRAQLILRALANDNEELYLTSKTSDEKVVGMLYGYRAEGRQEIIALYTDSAYRRQGMGRALIEHFIKWSDQTEPIELGVLSDNIAAIQFYESVGFDVAPGSHHAFELIEGETEITMIRKGDDQR
jgi:ribosomal protein S18 acetylase RimI-like enzyme